MKLRLTPEADADIASALRQTRKLFGARQVLAYAYIIDHGISMVAENPCRPGCLARDEIREGVKSFHLELVTRRRGSASHLLYFKLTTRESGDSEIVIIGLIHERMEPKRKLGRILRSLDDERSVDLATDQK